MTEIVNLWDSARQKLCMVNLYVLQFCLVFKTLYWKQSHLLLAIQKYYYLGTQNCNSACYLYGCETWSLTLREERRLRMFENKVLRRLFGPKRDEVTGEGRKLHIRSLIICTPHPVLFG